MRHTFSKLIALLGLVVAGLTVTVLPITPATGAPVLSSMCEFINDPSFDSTTVGAQEGRLLAVHNLGGSFYAGETVRFVYSAGGADNEMHVQATIYDNDDEENLLETSDIASGTGAHTITFTIPYDVPQVSLVVLFTMAVGTSTGTVTSLCYRPHDHDGDGVDDVDDNCIDVANGDQQDSDHDGKGDLCDDEPPPSPTAQSISFGQPADILLGGPDVVLVATASSGLTVGFTSLTPSTCSVTAGKAHPLAAGTCTIAADQPGNTAYLPAPRQTRTLAITKGSLLITTSAETTWIHPKPRHAYTSVVRSALTGQPVAGIVVTTSVPRSGSAKFGCTAPTNALGVASCHSTDYYAMPARRTYVATAKPSATYLGATATAPLPSAF